MSFQPLDSARDLIHVKEASGYQSYFRSSKEDEWERSRTGIPGRGVSGITSFVAEERWRASKVTHPAPGPVLLMINEEDQNGQTRSIHVNKY